MARDLFSLALYVLWQILVLFSSVFPCLHSTLAALLVNLALLVSLAILLALLGMLSIGRLFSLVLGQNVYS